MRLQKIIPLLLIFSNVVSRVFSADSPLTNDAVAKNLDNNNKVKVNAVEVIHAADSSTPTNDAVANLDDNEVKVKTVEVLHEELYGLAMQVSTVPYYYLITDKGHRKTQGPWVHDEHNKAQNLT